MAVVLVIGGAGYIGSQACKELVAAGHVPVVFDNLSAGRREAVQFGPFVEGDILDPSALASAFAEFKPSAVMHFAALTSVPESVAQPERYWRINVAGSLALLDAMRAAGASKLVFSSTAAVYGKTDAELIAESCPLAPSNPYGATKLTVETMLRDFSHAHGLRYAAFRYFNVAGADPDCQVGECHQPETHLIPLVLQAASGQRDNITVFGNDYATPDGTCVRDYVHVKDVATAHVLALQRLLDGGDSLVSNLGTGRGYSVLDVIGRVQAVTGLAVPHTVAERRPGDPPRLVCDGRAASTALGWSPARSDIDAMIADAWRWHQSGWARAQD
ncbi:MAG: UDP-glucose 4-epimerase GalE [Alphaproteobacteria bacterium]